MANNRTRLEKQNATKTCFGCDFCACSAFCLPTLYGTVNSGPVTVSFPAFQMCADQNHVPVTFGP